MTRSRRRLLAAAMALLAVVALLIAWGAMRGGDVTLRIGEAELQARLGAAMPRSWEFRERLTLTLDNPELRLRAGSDRAEVGVDARIGARLAGRDIDYRARVSGSAGIRYEAATASLHLHAPMIDTVDLPGVPPRQRERVRDALTTALTDYYATRPLYTLRDDELRQATARRVLRELRIEDGVLVVVLGLP